MIAPIKIIALDPGYVQTAYCVYDPGARRVLEADTLLNHNLLSVLYAQAWPTDLLAVEMIESFGMAVGREVFETVFWIGRFVERWAGEHRRVYRKEVKLHLCGHNRATDSNIRTALLDRYGPGREAAVGTKKHQGPLYGIKGDQWSALAVAITAAETPILDLAAKETQEALR